MDQDQLSQLNADVRARRVRLWHGGVAGLRPGDQLLPPAVTGATGMRQESIDAGFKRIATSESQVYVTTERSLARAIAAHWSARERGRGRGWVYRVDLEEFDLAIDDDLPRGPFISFQLPSARVAIVADSGVDSTDPRHARVLQRFVGRIP